jgi:hypothetical protein
MAKYIPTGKRWIRQAFRAKAVINGGVIRRNVVWSPDEIRLTMMLKNTLHINCYSQRLKDGLFTSSFAAVSTSFSAIHET